jgi:hypothetical protein
MNANCIIKCIYKEQNSIQPLIPVTNTLKGSVSLAKYFAILVDLFSVLLNDSFTLSNAENGT